MISDAPLVSFGLHSLLHVTLVCVYTELNADPSLISAHGGIYNSLVSLSILSSKINILVYFRLNYLLVVCPSPVFLEILC